MERLHETCQHQDDTEGPINVLNRYIRYSSVNHLQAVYTIYFNHVTAYVLLTLYELGNSLMFRLSFCVTK